MHLHEKIVVVKSILALHPQGATFQQISEDFLDLVKEDIECTYVEFYGMMSNLKDICFVRDFYGNMYWQCYSKKTSHIRNMIQYQKSTMQRRKKIADHTIKPCNFFEDSWESHIPVTRATRVQKRSSNVSNVRYNPYRRPEKRNLRDSERPCNITPPEFVSVAFGGKQDQYDPHLYGHQLIGDDFMLSLAKLEMGFSLKPDYKRHQSGLCISGQTIRGAIDRISAMSREEIKNQVIINLGSVDLLHGRDVLDMRADYMFLLELLKDMGVQAIVTTLPPIANFTSLETLKKNWEKFNCFLLQQSGCIDIKRQMMQNGRILFSCYQGEAKYVTGSNRPHVLWNKIGRQRILKELKSYLSETF